MSYTWYQVEVATLEELRREAAAATGDADERLRPGEALLIQCAFGLPFVGGPAASPLAGVVPGGPEWAVEQHGRGGRTLSFRIWHLRGGPSAPN